MTSRPTLPSDWVDRLQATLETFDEAGGHRVLTQLFDELDLELAIGSVVLPYLQAVGQRWENGAIGVAQEHFASNVIRTRLSLLLHAERRNDGPVAVLACMPGELHEFGLMAMALALSRQGWRTVYLGANTPTAEVALRCLKVRPTAVVLSALRPTAFAAHGPALRRLAASTTVYLAARGASLDVSELCNARLLADDPVTGARRLQLDLAAHAGTHERGVTESLAAM